MDGTDKEHDPRAEEIVTMARAIRDRVRAAYPAEGGSVPIADLMPLVHARDSAEGKVAAIGTVNPRRGGPLNSLVQAAKRLISRALDWHVREQVEYNRALIECVNITIEALNEANRALVQLASRQKQLENRVSGQLAEELGELKDIRAHWEQWRQGWEEKLVSTELQFLRGLAEVRAAFDQRISSVENSFRAAADARQTEFHAALDARALAFERELAKGLTEMREEFERLIHRELRVVRQRAIAQPRPEPAAASAPAGEPLAIDYLSFADRFRGSEEYVRRNQEFYVQRFRACGPVLDIGCGRGEFLEALREAGIEGMGVDLDEEFVNICRSKSLAVERADMFACLDSLEDGSLGGLFCSQVIEHLPPGRLPELIRLAHAKLARGALAAFETPNPACLAIFATHFYLDPTHTRPVPASLMSFYLEEAGFGQIEVNQLSPAVESMPSLATLPDEFRQAFFGGLDYAVMARRL